VAITRAAKKAYVTGELPARLYAGEESTEPSDGVSCGESKDRPGEKTDPDVPSERSPSERPSCRSSSSLSEETTELYA
jgi:hypothetical protein